MVVKGGCQSTCIVGRRLPADQISGNERPCRDAGVGEIALGLAMLKRANRASHIDPPASSNAIMRRARPYCGENPEPGKDVTESLTPRPELENDQDPKATHPTFMVPRFFGERLKEAIHTGKKSHKLAHRGANRNGLPLSCSIIPVMTRLPKPLRVGGSTGGPPVSVQRRTSSRSAPWAHFMPTSPMFLLREPYFPALVASS